MYAGLENPRRAGRNSTSSASTRSIGRAGWIDTIIDMARQERERPRPRVENAPVASKRRPLATGATIAVAMVVVLPTPIESARWWHSPRIVHILRLSAPQQSAIDRVYQEMWSERVAMARRAKAAHATLERLLESDASDTALEEAATRAADADAARHRLRTMMLYRMSLVLTPEQRARLTTLARAPRREATP